MLGLDLQCGHAQYGTCVSLPFLSYVVTMVHRGRYFLRDMIFALLHVVFLLMAPLIAFPLVFGLLYVYPQAIRQSIPCARCSRFCLVLTQMAQANSNMYKLACCFLRECLYH
jgi:hypothetical protein